MIRATKRIGTEKKEVFECSFLRVRARGQREIKLTSVRVRVKKRVWFSILTILALAGYYLVATWLANR